MYQRFYKSYETNLDLTNGAHPHPVIRNEFFHKYLLTWIISFLDVEKSEVAYPLTYMFVRSSLMSGLFGADRIESFDGKSLPTYMDLSSENYQDQRSTYMDTIRTEIISLIPSIKRIHLLPTNCITLFEESLIKSF